MANRKNTFLIKRSNVAGKVPAPGDLLLGEMALNTADVKLYASGTTANEVLPIGWDRVSRTGDTMTGTLYAPSVSASTFEVGNYIDFGGNGVPTAVSGRTYFDVSENALSYYPETPLMDVTINLGQETVIYVYNGTGSLVTNGSVCDVHGPTVGGRPSIRLAIASATTDASSTLYTASGIATHDIPDGEFGFITRFGLVRDLNITGKTVGTDIWLSDTVAGGFVYDPSELVSNNSRITRIGHLIATGTTDAVILVTIDNEPTGKELSSKEATVLVENQSSTGSFEGGGVTSASATTFNVSAGRGLVSDNSDPAIPILTQVEWSAFSNVTSTYVSDTGETYTYLTIDSTGTLIQTPGSTTLTDQQKRQQIIVGGLLHIGGTILFAWDRQIPLVNPMNNLEDLTTSIGSFSVSGNRILKITGTLELEKSLGSSFYLGGDNVAEPESPNILTTGILSGSTLVYSDGQNIIGLSGTSIDVDNYDPDGLGTLSSIGGNNFAAHRIWHQPTENVVIFQYAQQIYTNLTDAKNEFQNETYLTPDVLLKEAYLVAVIICRTGETDLDNAARSVIVPQGKFAGTGGGGSTLDTLQTAYNNSITPEIVTNSTNGSVDFKSGVLNTSNLVTFQSTGGTINAYIQANGNATFSGQVDTNTVRLISTPTLDNNATNILVRNTATGVVDYRTVNSLSGAVDTNFYVTGGTSDSGGTITLNLKGTSDVLINNRETKEINILAFEGASITASPTYLTTTGTLVHSYAGGNVDDNEGAYNFSVPSDYVSGGSLYIKFMTVTSTSANVQFEMNVTSIDVGGDFSTATDTGLLQITQGDTAYNLIKTGEFTGGTATYSAGKNVSVKVNRDASDAGDTYNNQDALLWGIVFEYTGIK